MSLDSIANTAVEEAYNLATGKNPNVNTAFNNNSGSPIRSFLINENIDRQLIETGVYTQEEVYGK